MYGRPSAVHKGREVLLGTSELKTDHAPICSGCINGMIHRGELQGEGYVFLSADIELNAREIRAV